MKKKLPPTQSTHHLSIRAVSEHSGTRNSRRLIRETECKHLTGLSRQRRWELEREGRFPKRIVLGSRSVAWQLSEIQSWLDNAAVNRTI